jgi:hypothetical protein
VIPARAAELRRVGPSHSVLRSQDQEFWLNPPTVSGLDGITS